MKVASDIQSSTTAVAKDQSERSESHSPIHRVWLLTNAPSPYQAELLSAIADRDDIELDVRFMLAGSPAGRAASSHFPYRVMRSVTPSFFREELLLHPRAIWECAFSRQDCFVLSGLYTNITFLICAFVLTLRRVPWIVWFERPHVRRPDERNRSLRSLMMRPVHWARDTVQKLILSSATLVLCIGTAAKEAYATLGVPEERLGMLPYCCDLDRYTDVDPDDVLRLKRQSQLEGKIVFLFSGQMIERKGVDTALAAFAEVANGRTDVAFVLLGDGPLRQQYEELVPVSLRSLVHFPGHVPQTDLPAYFVFADVFVFPSRHDGWGVVVNEACAAGLPVITTPQTGAAHDLVEDGHSGFIRERNDVVGFAQAMQQLLDHPSEREAFGHRSRQLVEQFSTSAGAARFQRVVTRAVDR